MSTGVTKKITGELTLTDRYELTANDDVLEISNAVINLNSPGGDLFTNEGNDTVSVVNSTINALAEGLSFFLGSGNDTLELNNSTVNAPIAAGSGNDLIRITGDAQSRVTLKKRPNDPTLSLGADDDILELCNILEGDGDIDFGSGNDTLRFDGGSLLTTGTLSNLSNLQVTANGGTLGRNLELQGTQVAITLGGNLTGTDNAKCITVSSEKILFNTANNVRTNIGFSISKTEFNHQDGGTIEINGYEGTAFSANDSTVSLHDFVVVNAKYGLSGKNTVWVVRDSNFSNNEYAADLSGAGSLELKNVGISNNSVHGLLLGKTSLTGDALTFTRNRGRAIALGGNLKLNSVDFISNVAFTSSFSTSGYNVYATTTGGAIYQGAGDMNIIRATFTGNSAGAIAINTSTSYDSSFACASATGGAIYQDGGDMSIISATFTENSADATASGASTWRSRSFTKAIGGAIYQNGGEMSVTSATFTLNSASAYASNSVSAYANATGGAIYARASIGNLTDATFVENFAVARASVSRDEAYACAAGGAVYWDAGDVCITRARFTRNFIYAIATSTSSSTSNAMGGAIYAQSSIVNLTEARFSGNVASAYSSTYVAYANAMGGAICAQSSIVNLTDTTFRRNWATFYASPSASDATVTANSMGGAIYLNDGKLNYYVSEGKSLINTGNLAKLGGFLYLANNSQATFDISGELTIGDSTDEDSIAGDRDCSISKNGAGVWTVNSDVSQFAGNWNIAAGVLKLERIARSILLDNWTIGVGAELHLSALNDTIAMGMDKKTGVINLGGGSDTINTKGYTLSCERLLISALTFTGGGTVNGTIVTRTPQAGFDLTLRNIKLNSDITGGNAVDSIKITQNSRLGGTIDLGDGDNLITATADTVFLKSVKSGNGNDTFKFSTVEFQQSVDLGDGDNNLTATGKATFSDHLNGGNGNDTLNFRSVEFLQTVDLGDGKNSLTATETAAFSDSLKSGSGDDTFNFSTVEFQQTVDLGDGKNSLTASGKATFSDRLNGGAGNDTITLQSDSTLNGLVGLGGGKNVITASGDLSVKEGFLLDPDGETRLVVNRAAALTGNTLNIYSHEGAVLKALSLDWSSIPDLDKVRIVVSSDSSFSRFEFAVELYNQSKNFTLNVEESYYIQFQAQDEDGWKQRYLPDSIAPDQVTGLAFEQSRGSWSVTHDNWGGNGVKQYHVEIATDSSFSSLVDSVTVGTTEYVFSLADGNYYWRVRAEDYTGNLGKWSETATVFIDYTAPTMPRGLISTTGDYSVTLGWTAAVDSGSGVARYEYRIASDSSFVSIVVSGESAVNSNVTVSNLVYGNYYWQVRAIDNSGNIGEWSLYKNFSIADTIAPTAPGELDYQLNGNTVTLDWLASVDDVSGSGLKEYCIEISNQADFSKITLTRTSKTTRISISDLAGGNYFCRVSAVDQSGNVSDWSDVQSFQIDGSTPGRKGPARSDFDGNGVSDILFQNLTDPANPLGAWMNADKWQWNGALGAAPLSDWTVYGAYDFTGDGVCDIMFRSKLSSTEYAVGYYDMGDNGAFKTMGWGVTAEWELADVGDFNGNGRADILWKNTTNGYLGLWMDGTDQWVALPASNLGAGQSIIGMGDVNGDGCDDILINSNGVLGAWDISGIINGTEKTPVWSSFGITIGSEWEVVGCADFDGNGKADIVLWRSDDGYIGTYMNCDVNDFRGIYPGASKSEWGIPGFGDFNGDGCDDVLVRNLGSGALGYWDGADGFKWKEIGSGVDSTWAVIAG